MFNDLKQVTAEPPTILRRRLDVTGVTWSDDRTIKEVVGPRGHLVELDIDPRAYRKPDSTALAATTAATVRLAVQDVARRPKRVDDSVLPSDMRAARIDPYVVDRLPRNHADLPRLGERTDG